MRGTTTEPPAGEGTQPERPRALARLGSRTRAGIRVFSSGTDAPRARRPTDVVLLVLAAAGIVLCVAFAPGPTSVDRTLARLVSEVPGLFGWFWEISYDLLFIWAVVLMAGPAVARGRRGLLADELLAIGLSFGIGLLAGRAAGSSWSAMVHVLIRSHPPAVFPAMRLAVATAVVVTASPHLTRPLRYIGRWVIGVGAVATIALGTATPLGVLGASAVGVAAGAVVHLLRGSPGGRPTLEQVADALRAIDVEAVDLRHASLEPRGAALVTGSTPDGHALLVKIYGRDAWEGQFFGSLWLRAWHRDDDQRVGFGRIQHVEHEALLT